MKRLLALLLALFLCACAALAEEGATLTSGFFEYELNEDGDAVITGYTGTASAVAVPPVLDGKKVVAVGKEAFSGLPVAVVHLSEGVTRIGEGAFKNCDKLISVILPQSVTVIGKSAFRNCASLRTLVLPVNIEQIDVGAFFGCEMLVSITLPEGLTEISNNLFNGCGNLEQIVVPESVTVIGSTAFMNCVSLTEVTLPETLTEIRAGAFSGCEVLETLTLPESLSSIGYGAFDSPNLVLSVVKGSYAESFCKQSKFIYIYTETAE